MSPETAPVAVVVPVHGAAVELGRCLETVRRHTDLAAHRLLLVVDGPQPAEVETLLGTLGGLAGVEILRQPARRGFAAAANRGIAAAGDRDVILLNSDTEVAAGWVEALAAAAASRPEVATATPFSNAATICSLPRWLEDNALPAGHTVESFAALVAERSARSYPALPTGVGVCLYLKRRCLDAVGPLDESYGLGYGEEVDWCLRAAERGFAHVLDDSTFVYHAGQASFGAERAARMRAATRRLRRRHPRHWRDLADFIRRDPLREARDRVVAGLLPQRRTAPIGAAPERVLHVVHGWPPWNHAGTELYAAWLVRRQAAWREVTVLARIADPRRARGYALELLDHGARVRLLVNNFTQRDPLSRGALVDRLLERDFTRLLAEVRPQIVHVHHLAGHSARLPGLARRRGIPVVYQVQDWWTLCARANLLDRWRQPCSGPGLGKCSRCLPLTGLPPAGPLNRALHALRRRLLRRALADADAWVMGSQAIAQSFRDHGLLGRGEAVQVLEYGIESVAATRRPPRSPGSPLRLGFIGSLLPHKGLHVAAAAVGALPSAAVRLEVWGSAAPMPEYLAECRALAGERLQHHGVFAEGGEEGVFAALDALLVPSVGLESYGLVAREALARGVPVLASRQGAFAELLAGRDCGALFAPGEPGELRAWIERLIAEPELLARWQGNAPRVRTMDEHAPEIEAVYREVLERRRSRQGAR